MSDCPICNPSSVDPGKNRFNCRACGSFQISETLLRDQKFRELNAEDRAKLSHWLRKQWDSRKEQKSTILTKPIFDNILKEPLPSASEQADLLIKYIAENSSPGIPIALEDKQNHSIIGAIHQGGFQFILQHLRESGLLGKNNVNSYHAILTVKGWERYREIQSASVSYRKAFMAMKFANEELCEILENVFKPCVKQAGFDLFRLDEAPKAGLIDDNMRVSIRTSDFVISDLSDDNPGAYWEAGYAEGLGKPVIYTCEKEKFEKEKPHFDTNHHLTIIWDKKNSQEAGEKLKATIRATLPHLAKMQDD
jgi:hypothetical protein